LVGAFEQVGRRGLRCSSISPPARFDGFIVPTSWKIDAYRLAFDE